MPPVECVLALDVGGTTIKVAIADRDGTVLHRARRDTGRTAGAVAVVQNILNVAQDLAEEADSSGYQIVAAGVVVPGVVDEQRGIAVASSNIGWRDVPLRELLQNRLGLPIQVGHDVRAGALAESRHGAAIDRSSFLFLPIGTGIGGALVIDGRPYTGASYAAAEVGHLVVRPDGELCVCGRVGCLETLASASAIARRYSDAAGHSVQGANDVAIRARSGDATAIRIWTEAIDALADALVVVTTLLDPELIVLGGGLAESGSLLLDPLRQKLSERIILGQFPQLACALLGDEAGCVGAALLALDLINGRL